MASAIIHICVAKKVNEYLKLDEKELFLGSIAPDISKQIGESKKKSHFITKVGNVPNVEAFLDKYKNEIKTVFDYGYLIHLYTDKEWYLHWVDIGSKIFGRKVLEVINDGYSNDVIQKIIYDNYTNMNIDLIDDYSLDLSLFYEDFKIPDSCIEEIPVERLNILIDQMGIIIANSKDKDNIVFDYPKIIEFIDNTAIKIVKFLKDNNI